MPHDSDSMTSKEIVDKILDKAEVQETVTVKKVDGVKQYQLNKKGRQFMSNRAIFAIETVGITPTDQALKEFREYVDTGIKTEYIEETLSKLLPFVISRLGDGMTGEEIKAEIEENRND